MKKILFMIIVIFMLNPLILSKGTDQIPTNNNQHSNQIASSVVFFKNITNISIEKIVDGIGITAIMKNNGGISLNNLTVTIDKTNGSFVFIKTRSFTIPTLEMNQSTEIHIRLFGIGLGKLTSPPEITIAVRTTEGIQKIVRITAKVFGPFTI